MRTLLILMLAGVLGTCPLWCATVETTLGPRPQAATHGDHAPGSTPVNDDDCLCNGALDAAGPAHRLLSECAGQAITLGLPEAVLPSAVDLARIGTGSIATRGLRLVARARDYLQSYRC